jgi:hypothetical protein
VNKHRGDDPNDVAALNGKWHVGRYWPDMFPALENQCPCPKAPCGLAVPVVEIPCMQHHGQEPLRQVHHVDQCRKKKPRIWSIDIGKRKASRVNPT